MLKKVKVPPVWLAASPSWAPLFFPKTLVFSLHIKHQGEPENSSVLAGHDTEHINFTKTFWKMKLVVGILFLEMPHVIFNFCDRV